MGGRIPVAGAIEGSRRVKQRKIWVAVLLAAAMMQSGLASADDVTSRAQTLLSAGKGQEAYRLLEPLEADRAGEIAYDVLLGQTALASGEATRAVFALERVLAQSPEHVLARAEIARAYMALGETKTALREFETVKQLGVPADVSMTVDRYIAEARRMEDSAGTKLSGFVEGTFGYDTNINAGPSRYPFAAPPLTETVTGRSDWFGALGGGINLRKGLGNDYALLAGVSANQRYNFGSETQMYDMLSGDANIGVTKTVDQDVFTLMAQASHVTIESDRYRTSKGLTGQWLRNLDARNQIGAFVQYNDLHYRTQDIRDADRWVGGVSYAHLWRTGILGFASAYAVSERPQNGAYEYFGFSGAGVRAGGRMNLDRDTVLFGGASWEYRGYSAVDPLVNVTRRDNQYNMLLGVTRFLSKDWTVTPQIGLTRNESNARLNDYHREVYSVSVRREF